LRELIDSGATPEEVLEHGRKFGQLTPRTSLLVLERWQDYESNGLPLPPDLREQKEADEKALHEQQATAERSRRAAMQVAQVAQHQAVPTVNQSSPSDHAPWFMTGQVVEGGTPIPGATVTLIVEGGATVAHVTDENGQFRFDTSTPPVSATLRAELPGFFASFACCIVRQGERMS
jgi:hypothetical protein